MWCYVLRVTEQPDPRVALLAGDVVHNLRSSLDHLAVALTGDKWSFFPVLDKDPWERDAAGHLFPNRLDDRKSFASAVKGAARKTRTIIKELQPYAAGADWAKHPLGLIRRFDNADKHKQLIATTSCAPGA